MAKSALSRILFSFFLVFALAGGAWASEVVSQGLRTAVNTAAPAEKISIILSFSTPAQTQATVRTQSVHGREELVRTLMYDGRERRAQLMAYLREQGVEPVRELWLIDSLAFEVTPELIEDLADWPGVASVRIDEQVFLPPSPTPGHDVQPAAFTDPQDNIDTVNASALWDIGFDGSGIVVAVMDSGVDVLHPDLASRWRGGANSWFDPFGGTSLPFDFLDGDGRAHGTGVAGVLVGGDTGGETIGAGPGAQWIAAKIFGDSALDPGESTFSRIHQAFQWLLDPDGDPATDDAPDIVNGSWGMGGFVFNECLTEFQPDIQALRESGIGVVFSAGNTGDLVDGPSSLSPANFPESFSVGSVDDDLNISSFSARGPSACDEGIFPDLVAPGRGVRSAALTQNGTQPLSYNLSLDGTSFSAPHVSGVLALLQQAFPGQSISELEAALRDSAVDLGDPNSDNVYGYGLVDARAAYQVLATQVSRPAQLQVRDSVFPRDDNELAFTALPETETTATVTIYNAGGGTLAVTSVALEGPDAGLLTLTGNCSDSSNTVSLLGAESCTIELSFTQPLTEGFSVSLVLQTSAGNLTLPINDQAQNVPQAQLSATALDFGDVPPESRFARIVEIENAGTGDLVLGDMDGAQLPAEIRTVTDQGGRLGCSGENLAPGERCRVYLLFSPTALGSVSGSFTVPSNDPQNQLITIGLDAVGNTPPPEGELVAPADGATVNSTVTFRLEQPPDADGHAVTSQVVFDTSPSFRDPNSAEANPVSAAMLGLPGLALLCLAVRRRRRILWTLALLVAGGVLLVACGGGGGDGTILPPPEFPEFERQATVTGLQSDTYYWKVRTTDELGAVVESPVRQFTVR